MNFCFAEIDLSQIVKLNTWEESLYMLEFMEDLKSW